MRSPLCRVTLGLWFVTILVAGWFFVRGGRRQAWMDGCKSYWRRQSET